LPVSQRKRKERKGKERKKKRGKGVWYLSNNTPSLLLKYYIYKKTGKKGGEKKGKRGRGRGDHRKKDASSFASPFAGKKKGRKKRRGRKGQTESLFNPTAPDRKKRKKILKNPKEKENVDGDGGLNLEGGKKRGEKKRGGAGQGDCFVRQRPKGKKREKTEPVPCPKIATKKWGGEKGKKENSTPT